MYQLSCDKLHQIRKTSVKIQMDTYALCVGECLCVCVCAYMHYSVEEKAYIGNQMDLVKQFYFSKPQHSHP